MPSTLFDSAGLAIVAYAQVDGATGSSTSSPALTPLPNSGVSTTRLAAGVYQLYLSTALGQLQDLSSDLIFVQPKITTYLPFPEARYAAVFEVSAGEKQVKIFKQGGTTTAVPMDSDFNVLILRTILS